MSNKFQAVRGMRDIAAGELAVWQHLERTLMGLFGQYGYDEIRMPVVEKTALFLHSIGEVTDIVEKEMYTFPDRDGESLSLRPEGTAGCARAAIELGLLTHSQRLWYRGPMFRYERPQKGRYRQFDQFGAEVFGIATPDIDAELILLSRRLWQRLGLLDAVELQLNSIGSLASRQAYRQRLVDYFQGHFTALDEDSQRRLQTNPLRILDSKIPQTQALVADAPNLLDFLDDEATQHFEGLRALLDAAGVSYRVNPRLVRGLDYYSKTVFEWVTDRLGAQGTVCAGGRYDSLVEHLGGRPTPAAGFGLGCDRVVALIEACDAAPRPSSPHAYLATMGEAAGVAGMVLAERLRDALPTLRLAVNCGGGSIKSQMKRADKSGARWALLVGDDEVAQGRVTVKPLRDANAAQQVVGQDQLADFFGAQGLD